MPSRTARRAELLLTVCAIVGLGVVASTVPVLLGAGLVDGIDVGGVVWGVATLAVAGCLLVGLVRRLNGSAHSTVLLVAGSPAPAMAWFWLPPVWLLAVGIAVTALISRAPIRPAGAEVRP
jgi:hypothetical protein